MKLNTASQSIGAQMTTAADGTAFTGAVSVLVTIDNGTQTAGGGTAPAHEGNGYHSYTPTQAETNGAHIAFTFTGTGAIASTVQVFTTFPQTGDNFARLGAPAGASVSADVAAVKVDTAATLVDTAQIGVAGAGLTNINLPNQTMDIVGNITGNVSGSVGSVTGAVGSVTGAVGSVTAGVTVTTNSDKTGYSISGTKTTLDALNDIAATDVVSSGAITTAAGAVSSVTTVGTLTTYTGNTPQTADHTAAIADIPTVAEFNARTLASADYFDPAADTVANVTLCATTTTNTDMRGTDSALLASSAPTNFGDMSISVTTGLVDITQTAADKAWSTATRVLTAGTNLNDLSAAAVNAEVLDVLNTDTFAEPASVPGATSTLVDKISWIFTLNRNKITQTSTTQLVRNDTDAATIGTSTVSDDGTTTSRGEYS